MKGHTAQNYYFQFEKLHLSVMYCSQNKAKYRAKISKSNIRTEGSSSFF